ncbi:MAG TPA: CDGSH iron-sulfur domain-containing protein [Actinomycetota bacterium]|nr:CDGSH iron-sulfur domain-containing protein [Actinomycetota bacterium]
MSDEARPRVKVLENGPYRVSGVPLVRLHPIYNEAGDGLEWERCEPIAADGTVDLCRCGQSKTKPFCDGSEASVGFDGTETADRRLTAERRRNCAEEGPMQLTDDRSLCSHMAFCQRVPKNAWSLVREQEDPETRELVISMVRKCPSGRLQYYLMPDPAPVEEDLPEEIGVVDNGPLWVRGGVQLEAADGFEYEARNRQTLCRCGQSANKPFCDGSHWDVGFTDP